MTKKYRSLHFHYLIALGLLLTTAPSVEARVLRLDQPAAAPIEDAAHQAVLAYARDLGAGPFRPTLRLRAVAPVPDGAVVYFDQLHQGLRLVNSGVSVLVMSGRLRAISGDLHPLPASSGDSRLPVALPVNQAQAERLFTQRYAGARVRSVELALEAPLTSTPGRQTRPVWILAALIPAPFDLVQATIDATDGRLLGVLSTRRSADGKVYSTNPTVGSLMQKSLKGLTKTDALVGEHADVSSCSVQNSVTLNCTRYASADTQGNFLHEPDEGKVTDPFSEVHTYYHVDHIHRWMKDSFGFQRQGSQQIKVMVNLHSVGSSGKIQGMSNAFFGDLDGDKKGDLVFGQGSRDYAYDADVVYHEFTHSVVDETSDLTIALDSTGFNMAPMALNEAFADLFSSMLAGDPIVGDYAGGYQGGIRTLTGSYTCPEYLSGESHYDGLILSQAIWKVRSGLSDTKTFDEALYTLMASLSKNAGFDDVATLFGQILKAKDATLAQQVDTLFKSRGLTTCTRIIPLIENQSRKSYIYGKSIAPSLPGVPGPFQYKIDVPQKAKTLTLYLKGSSWGSQMGAYLRVGQTVGYDYVGPLYDHVMNSNVTSLTLDVKDTKATLQPGKTYYVLPLNVSTNADMLVISFTTLSEDPPPVPDAQVLPPDAGTPAPDQTQAQLDGPVVNPGQPLDPASEGGCSCTLNEPPHQVRSAWPLLLFGCLLLGLTRRRR